MNVDENQRRPRLMRLRDFTTVELQRIARILLRRYVEVQTGAAPAVALARFLAPVVAADLQRLSADDRARGRVRHSDLGPVSVLRLGADRGYATAALVRPGEEAPAILSVEFEVRGQRLAAVRVGEAESRPSRQELPEVPRAGPGQPVPEPPAHLAGLLGDLPGKPHALGSWVAAAAAIDTYRERYGIDDVTSAFGLMPSDPEQREERERALAYVRQLAREVEAIEPQQERGLGRDRPASPELGR
jgi:hypothetical protein